MRQALNPGQILAILDGFTAEREHLLYKSPIGQSERLAQLDLLEAIYQVALQIALLREKLEAPES